MKETNTQPQVTSTIAGDDGKAVGKSEESAKKMASKKPNEGLKKPEIALFLCLIFLPLCAMAQKITHNFNHTSLSDALTYIAKNTKDYRVNFIYNELEDFTVTTYVVKQSVPDAIRQIIGLYPMHITIDGQDIFVECMQKEERKLTGRVVDKNGSAIPFASIVLLSIANQTFINGGVSNESGEFVIPCKEPRATVRASCVGYNTAQRSIENSTKPIIMTLEPATEKLGEVVVSAKKPLVQRKIDRIVFDAERLNAVATNFLDVLKRTPGIIVQDDEIGMLNKGKLIMLMNGREINMDMKSLVAYLGSLNGNQLKEIEVMTTPPAKYSAEGNAGVINLVTKKLKNDYWGGSVANTLSIKEHTYDGIAVSLQYKHDRLEAYANAGMGFGDMQSNYKQQVSYPTETWTTETRRMKSNDYAMVTAGADYALTKNSSLGAIMTYLNLMPDAGYTANTNVNAKDNDADIKHYETLTGRNSNMNRWNANLHYTLKDIAGKGQLDINVDYLNYNIHDREELQTTNDETLSYLNHPSRTINIYQLKADMEMPIGKANLDYGLAYSRSKTDSRTDYERISNKQDLDDHFIYLEDIYAAYADMEYRLSDKWETKVGLRGEYGKLNGNSIKLNNQHVKYQFDLFPTAYLNYSWNDDNSLSLSMTSRINRPSYVDINPFTKYTDAHTMATGNPQLLPSKSYSAELGYTYGNLSVSASASWKDNVIFSYTAIDDARKITITTVDNVMMKQMYSLDLSYYFDRISWFDTSIDASLYRMDSEAKKGYDLPDVHHVSTFIYMNNNIYFNRKKTFAANLWGQYQGREEDVTGYTPSWYRMDLGLKCLLFNKRLSIGLEYQNMLASHVKSIIKTQNEAYEYDSTPFRILKFTLSYRFGKSLKVKAKKFGIGDSRL